MSNVNVTEELVFVPDFHYQKEWTFCSLSSFCCSVATIHFGFGTTWGWVHDDGIVILGETNPKQWARVRNPFLVDPGVPLIIRLRHLNGVSVWRAQSGCRPAGSPGAAITPPFRAVPNHLAPCTRLTGELELFCVWPMKWTPPKFIWCPIFVQAVVWRGHWHQIVSGRVRWYFHMIEQ